MKRIVAAWIGTVLLVALVAYPLSYAPMLRREHENFWRMLRPIDPVHPLILYRPPIDGSNMPQYKPVDWLIDNTPLREPLFAWARLWGVEHDFRESASMRRMVAWPTGSGGVSRHPNYLRSISN